MYHRCALTETGRVQSPGRLLFEEKPYEKNTAVFRTQSCSFNVEKQEIRRIGIAKKIGFQFW